jgi:hypothetical protein
MCAPDPADLDERFAELLAVFDEALARGEDPDPTATPADCPELAQRLRRAQAGLCRLEADRRRHRESLTPEQVPGKILHDPAITALLRPQAFFLDRDYRPLRE